MRKIDPRMMEYLGEFGITPTATSPTPTSTFAPITKTPTPSAAATSPRATASSPAVPASTPTMTAATSVRMTETSLDPYDYASQNIAGNPARLAAFNAMIDAVFASTQSINRQRAERLAGAIDVDKESPQRRRILMPMQGKECPKSGALAYVWTDLFAAASDNLKKLSDMPPPRYTPGGQIMQWSGLIRWNWKLLVQALNIREEFLFPSEYTTQHTQFELSAEDSSKVVYGSEFSKGLDPSRWPSFWQGTGRHVFLDAALTPTYVSGWFAAVEGKGERGNVLFTNSDTGFSSTPEEDAKMGNALSRGLANLAPARVARLFPQTGSTPRVQISMEDTDVAAWIRDLGRNARLAIRWDLLTHIFKSSAFYVLNHIPYWQYQGYISVNSKEVKEAQVAALNAAWQSGTPGMIQGAVVGILGAANPVMGSAARLLSTAGNVIMEQFVFRQLDPGVPVTFWVRSPGDPTCDATSTIEDEGRKLAVQRAVLNLSLGRLPDLSFLPRVAVGGSTGTSTGTSTSTSTGTSTPEEPKTSTAEGGGGTTPAISTPLTAVSGGGGGGSGALIFGAGAAVLYFLMRRS